MKLQEPHPAPQTTTTPITSTASAADTLTEIDQTLARPPVERAREFKYRFGQSVVFGLPVVALHYVGSTLGGSESLRWTGLFQTLLAGWVIYVAAAGPAFEGILLLTRRRFSPDLPVALLSLVLYGVSVVAWGPTLLRDDLPDPRMRFHLAVLILMLWSGARGAWLSRAIAREIAQEEEQTCLIARGGPQRAAASAAPARHPRLEIASPPSSQSAPPPPT